MTILYRFLKESLLDGDKGSFGRLYALPFLFSAWLVGTISGIANAVHMHTVLDDVLALAGIGIALYTGSKTLSIKGRQVELEQSESAVETAQ